MVPVQDRSAATLIPIIEEYILQGTTIYSDEWESYNVIPPGNFQHLTVNQSKLRQSCNRRYTNF